MKSFEPMISAPLNCSAGGRPSSIHSLPMGETAAADVEHEGNAAFGQSGPERIVVGMTGCSASRRAGGDPDETDAHVQRGIELDQRPLRVVEVADGNAVESTVAAAEPGHSPVVRSVGAVAQCDVLDLEQRRAERRVHDLVLEAEKVEGAAALVGVHRAQRPVPFGSPANEVVTQPDQSGALVLGVLPHARIDAVRNHHGIDVRQPVAQRWIDVVAQEARPLHEVAVRVDDAANARVRH